MMQYRKLDILFWVASIGMALALSLLLSLLVFGELRTQDRVQIILLLMFSPMLVGYVWSARKKYPTIKKQ
jgi:hypothetical protein